jgi:pimeloyl-ACP methyl ester carboxylesterase
MVDSSPSDSKARGSAVLVHGLWGFPDDWRWVRPLLEAEGIQVVTPDLPSERSSSAGLADDADEVRRAIRACAPPVVVAGWSHSGPVISMAAAGESSVIRLIYIGEIPRRQIEDPSWIYSDPNVEIGDDGTIRLVAIGGAKTKVRHCLPANWPTTSNESADVPQASRHSPIPKLPPHGRPSQLPS